MRYTIFFFLCIFLGPRSAEAQTADTSVNTELTKVGAPSPRSSLNFENSVQFNVSSTESNASIKLSRELSGEKDSNDGLRFAAIATAPINKGNSTFASLDGLANGTTLEVRVDKWRLNGIVSNTDDDVLAWCKNHLEPKYKEKQKSLEGYHCSLQTAEFLRDKGDKDIDVDSLRRLLFKDNVSLNSWGFSGRFGYQDIEYYDLIDLAKKDKRLSAWSFGLFASTFRPLQGRVFAASINVERAADRREQEVRCLQAASSTNLLTCANGVIGEPGHKVTRIAAFEYRQRTIANLAFALQLSRDIRNHITTAQLPVYFIRSEKQGLTGGIRLGWSSQDHKTVAGIFVGQAFAWLNNN